MTLRFPRTRWGAAALGAVLTTLLLAVGFVLFVASLERRERDPPSRADAIVALTGGAERIRDAIELLSRGFGRRLLITGVNERTSRDEIAKLSPGQRRLVECCVDLDYRARNTVGNAVETRRWMQEHGFGSLIVVTSNYHMPRTMTELDHVMPGLPKVAHPVVTGGLSAREGWFSLNGVRLLFGEYAKYLAVLVRTRIPGTTTADAQPPRAQASSKTGPVP